MNPATLQPASAWEPDKVGMFIGLPMETYLKAPGVSRSMLRTVGDRPKHVVGEQQFVSSEVQQWGTLFNDRVLFDTKAYHLRPDTYVNEDGEEKPWSGNSKVCKAWVKEHADKPVLRAQGEHSALWLERAHAKLMADRRCLALLKRCPHREVSIFARYPEPPHFLMKGRLDLFGFTDERDSGAGVVFADIKTTTDASTRNFAREILRFGYHEQFAHYRAILHALRLSPAEGFMIIAEKGDDPRVQARQLAERAMDKGDLDLDDKWVIYARCRQKAEWPEFADEPEEAHVTGMIDLPDHCYGKEGVEITASNEEKV